MTRPKVPDDKRQRTAQACDMCKRRKQKCNGEQPCQACGKRQSQCRYGSKSPVGESPLQPVFSPLKRGPSPMAPSSGPERAVKKPALELDPVQKEVYNGTPLKQGNIDLLETPVAAKTTKKASGQDIETQYSGTSGAEDEAEVYTETRMLQAPDGRPIYLGDSAPLSGLQLLRAIVENSFGQCDFTTDPSRHQIIENIVELPPNHELPGVFPSLPASNTLLEAFFVNTHGLVEIFNRADFERAAAACLNEPFIAKPKLLCLIYLSFAIGLTLATPEQGSKEEGIVGSLRQSGFDVAENFFRNTRRLVDPLTIQENADFWSVQILCLMSIYMLSISRRNAAYSYLGMAVQSALALGLHRGKETHVIFPPDEQTVRRNVWRTVFVLDRFLAAALGRPTMITEEDCSDDSLNGPGEPSVLAPRIASSVSLAVEIAKVIGRILQKIYSTRRVSVRLGQQFAVDCDRLEKFLREELHWKRAMDPATPPTQAVSVLHLNLSYDHAVVLYTRPFFLFLLKKDQVDGIPPARFGNRMRRFSQTCVTTSEHTVRLVHGAFAARYLPRRNPFVIHFLFAASLIILGNEFAGLHPNPEYHAQISKILDVISYCAKTDPQAERLMYILRTFKDVVLRRREHQVESDPSKAPNYPFSPEEMQSAGRSVSTATTGRKPSNATFSDVSHQRTSITSTGSVVSPIHTRVGTYPGILPMPPTIQSGALNGSSPASTNSYFQPTLEGIPGRRTSDGHTSAGEDEVYLEQLWSGVNSDAAAGVSPFQSLSDGTAKMDGRNLGPFGVYSIFMRGTERGGEGASGSGVPLFLQSLLNPDMSG